MAVKHIFGKNKEIFTHDLFVDAKFPYLFLPVSLCSVSQTFVQCTILAKKTLWFLVSEPYGFSSLLLMISFDTTTHKIYARSVMKMGREPRHSFMVTIPRKVCEALRIEKGTQLYFKLEVNGFAVSQDPTHLEDNSKYMETTTSDVSKKDKEDLTVGGISLADLHY